MAARTAVLRSLKTVESTPMRSLDTAEGRREALRQADVSLRIEDLERDPASELIFEAWVQGTITEQEAIHRLLTLG